MAKSRTFVSGPFGPNASEEWFIPKGTPIMEVKQRDTQLEAQTQTLSIDITIDRRFQHIPSDIKDHEAFLFDSGVREPPTTIYVPTDALKFRVKIKKWTDQFRT